MDNSPFDPTARSSRRRPQVYSERSLGKGASLGIFGLAKIATKFIKPKAVIKDVAKEVAKDQGRQTVNQLFPSTGGNGSDSGGSILSTRSIASSLRDGAGRRIADEIHRGLPRLGSPRRKFPKGPKIPLFHGRGPRIPVFPRGIRNGPVAENPGAVYTRGIRSGSVVEAPASLVRPRYSREFIDNFFANLKVKGASAGGRSDSGSSVSSSPSSHKPHHRKHHRKHHHHHRDSRHHNADQYAGQPAIQDGGSVPAPAKKHRHHKHHHQRSRVPVVTDVPAQLIDSSAPSTGDAPVVVDTSTKTHRHHKHKHHARKTHSTVIGDAAPTAVDNSAASSAGEEPIAATPAPRDTQKTRRRSVRNQTDV